MSNPSIAQLQRAVQISEQIEKLEAELKSVLGGFGTGNGREVSDQSPKKRRGRPPKSTATPVAQPAENEPATEPKAKRKKRKLSPEARAKIVAAVKARWAREKGTK